MKIIQTLFESGDAAYGSALKENRHLGGWISSRYHYMSWVYSCLSLRQFYPDVELYTNHTGYDILIDKLKLPYSNVHQCPDAISTYPAMLWSVSKLHTYNLQDEPFIHADGDVFIWEKFPGSLESAGLLAQNQELNFPFYFDSLAFISQHTRHVPKVLSIDPKNEDVISVNSGIFGGHDVQFIRRFVELALQYIHDNLDIFRSSAETGKLNVVIEQLLFARLAQAHQKPVKYLFNDVGPDFEPVLNIHKIPFDCKYLHLMGNAKKSPLACNALENFLRRDFPEYYERLNDFFPSQNDLQLFTPSVTTVAKGSYPATKMVLEDRYQPGHLTDARVDVEVDSLLEADGNKQVTDIIASIFNYEKGINNMWNGTEETLTNDYLHECFLSANRIFSSCSREAIMSKSYKLGPPYRIHFSRYPVDRIINSEHWVTKVQTGPFPHPGEYIYIFTRVPEGIKTETITHFGQLLYYFSNGPLTGNDLVDIITEGQELNFDGKAFYQQIVFDFILRSCSFFGHVIACNTPM